MDAQLPQHCPQGSGRNFPVLDPRKELAQIKSPVAALAAFLVKAVFQSIVAGVAAGAAQEFVAVHGGILAAGGPDVKRGRPADRIIFNHAALSAAGSATSAATSWLIAARARRTWVIGVR